MPPCYCQFAQCQGASLSIAAFNKHQREDRMANFHRAVDSAERVCRLQDEAILSHVTSSTSILTKENNGLPSSGSTGTKSYQQIVNTHLLKLRDIEKKVDILIASSESSLTSLSEPSSREEVFPLSPAIASVRSIFHELSQVSSRSPAVQEAKACISNRLYHVIHKLKEARLRWKKVQDQLPRTPVPDSCRKDVYENDSHNVLLLSKTDPIIQAAIFTMVVLQVALHLSRRGCHFLLHMLRYIVQLSLLRNRQSLSPLDQKLLADFPKDPDTAMKQFLLDGNETIYAVCPKATCQKLHAPRISGTSPFLSYPKYCSHSEFNDGNECGTRLTRPRFYASIEVEVPIKRFVAFSFKEYVGSLISRAGLEDLMDNSSASATEENTSMRDAFDGQFLRNFIGPDGKAFRSTSGSEGRYCFSLGFDFFNPFSNKQSGKKVSAGVISVLCLNLPISIRYKPENMFLAGVIPGPNEPPLTAANHYISPLVDEFAEFWELGVRYSRTARSQEGRLIYCALVLVVCDLLAARKIAGFAACTSEHFCNVCECRLSQPGLQDTNYFDWKMRTDKEYREAMDRYLGKANTKTREDAFKQHGVRWSELKRLSYFNMVDCVVVDPVHNHFLGLINEHFTNILGIRLRPFQEDTVLHLDSGFLPENMPDKVVKGVERLRSWLQKPYSTTFGPTREQGINKMMRINLPALEFVCNSIKCPVPILPEGRDAYTKREYCESILIWREEQDEIRESGATSSTICGHVLTADEMADIWADIEQMITPSWMTSIPHKLGQPSHGKLKADQWRTLGTTHLAISLIRSWAITPRTDERSRRCYDILRVTMSLISAILIATSQTISTANANAYLTHMLDYLEGIKLLFPGYKLHPNHHMALHIHRYLILFGPVHSWWTFPFERLNGILQRMPNNGRTGEVEDTIGRAYTRLGNLKTLLSQPGCPEVVLHSQPFVEELFHHQLRDNLRITLQPQFDKPKQTGKGFRNERALPADLRFALLRAGVETPSRGHLPSHISIKGLTFATASKHPGNSCVMITTIGSVEPVPAQLVYIVSFGSQNCTYLVVRRHKVAQITCDPYLCFPILRAQIWDANLAEFEVITPAQVVCHFACLPLKVGEQELAVTMSLSHTILLNEDIRPCDFED